MHMPVQQRTRMPVGAYTFWRTPQKGELRVLVQPTQDSLGSRLDPIHPSDTTSQANVGFRPLSRPKVDHTSEGMMPSHFNKVTS